MDNHSDISQASTIKFAGSHGYRIDGDIAFLNAEIAVLDQEAHGAEWALQLWACEQAHAGGLLSGFKVAEAKVELPATVGEPGRLEAEAFARLPADRRDYSMVLVLASASRDGAFEQVHDFANYPARQPFVAPHLDGAAGYVVDGEEAVLRADRISNPRPHDNLSGSLSLDLCAVAEPYDGGERHGTVLATSAVGQLAGQSCIHHWEQRVAFSAPPAGQWYMVLMLREWTLAAGFVTRDFCSFAVPYETPAESTPAPAAATPASAVADLTETIAAIAAVEPKEVTPEIPAAAVVAVDEEDAIPASEQVPVVPATRDRRVSIQTASVDELGKVKGLTKKVALDIVKLRPFTALEDLLRVRGIGDKLLRKLRDHLTV
jgi:competence ComEA-like helix-hairpin-helix protein